MGPGRMSSIMESMGKKRPRRRRSFTPEFKAEIVELCQRGDRSVGQVLSFEHDAWAAFLMEIKCGCLDLPEA